MVTLRLLHLILRTTASARPARPESGTGKPRWRAQFGARGLVLSQWPIVGGARAAIDEQVVGIDAGPPGCSVGCGRRGRDRADSARRRKRLSSSDGRSRPQSWWRPDGRHRHRSSSPTARQPLTLSWPVWSAGAVELHPAGHGIIGSASREPRTLVPLSDHFLRHRAGLGRGPAGRLPLAAGIWASGSWNLASRSRVIGCPGQPGEAGWCR